MPGLYTIPDSAELYPSDPTNGNDTDGDLIPDLAELQLGLNLNNGYDAAALRQDGLTWLEAYQAGYGPEPVDPELDSDSDGMKDVYEITHRLNRWSSADAWHSAAQDFIFNWEKANADVTPGQPNPQLAAAIFLQGGYDPAKLSHDWRLSDEENDWDRDGVSNRDELQRFGTDPRTLTSHPTTEALIQALTQAQASVTTLRNLAWLIDSNANVGLDTDGDGLPDSYEKLIDTKIDKADSDGDGIADRFELLNGFNPTAPEDAALDRDEDGLSNLREFQLGTGVDKPDSDGDGMKDGFEAEYGLNPSDGSDAGGDADGDGLSNGQEAAAGSNPGKTDSDGDGLSDSEEGERGSSPALSDTDNDGVPDRLDAVPWDGDFTHPYRPLPNFAVIRLNPAYTYWKVNDRGELLCKDLQGRHGIWRANGFHAFSEAKDLNNHGDAVSETSRLLHSDGTLPNPQPLQAAKIAPPSPEHVLAYETFIIEGIDDNRVVHGRTTVSYYLPSASQTPPGPCDPGNAWTKTFVTTWQPDRTIGEAGVEYETRSEDGPFLQHVTEFGRGDSENGFSFEFRDSVNVPEKVEYSCAGAFNAGRRIPVNATYNYSVGEGWSGIFGPDHCNPTYNRRFSIINNEPSPVEYVLSGMTNILKYPDAHTHTPPQIDWVNNLGIASGRLGWSDAYLWVKGTAKPIGCSGGRVKINDLGQAILPGHGHNFWQNGKVWKFDRLAPIAGVNRSVQPIFPTANRISWPTSLRGLNKRFQHC